MPKSENERILLEEKTKVTQSPKTVISKKQMAETKSTRNKTGKFVGNTKFGDKFFIKKGLNGGGN